MPALDTRPKSYSEIFEERGSSYDIAMRRYPRARDAEFAQVIEAARIEPGMRVGDVPAGGGYLRLHLPAGATWEGHEPCAAFTNHGATSAVPLLPLPWADGALDVVVSLAGIHHVDDKVPLFTEARRVVKPGGRLVVSDVEQGSAVARFLDGFVGDHNSTGHEGAFLSAATLDELRTAGWNPVASQARPFHWEFADRAEMADFTRHLFDVAKAPDDETIASAIERELGTVRLSNGRLGMAWSLLTIACERC